MTPLKSYALAVAYGLAGAVFAPGSVQAQQSPDGGVVSMKEVDIRAFIEDVSKATGRTFIVDPRVTGRVTVIATQALSERELFDVFVSTLRVNGFAAVPTSTGAYRIVPDEVAAREPAQPSAARSAGDQDRYVTQVFSLRFADAESVSNAIRPMLSARGQVTATRKGNALVVVDYGSTVRRVQEAVSQLDQDTAAYRTIRLRNTSAAEMARVAQGLLAAEGSNGSLVQIVPVASSNTLVLRGDQRTLDRYSPLIQELDVGADFRSAVKVITLKYAAAEEILPVLQQISASMTNVVAEEGGPSVSSNRRANIAAHKATNSLIISADTETQESLAEVVRSLDVRRQQILVEAIIVEVSDSAAKDLGIQFLLTGDGANAVPFLSTSYANTAPNLLALTGALLVKDSDDASSPGAELRRAAVSSLLGAQGAIGGVAGQLSDGTILGLILNALQQDTQSNVLSTPSVMTLDNETASILVGQQIPITTGEALSDSNTNPFRTVSREDVGVELEVTPQISEGGAIRLNIRQEVSSIFGTVSSSSDELITNQRLINTVVQVDAGQVIVLGGLIQDDIQRSDSGVPGLKNIPFAGRLFRSESKSRGRTNLMVFLRPTIVNTAEQAEAVTMRQFNAVQGVQGIDPVVAARIRSEFGAGNPVPVAPNALDAAPAPQTMFSPSESSAQPQPQ